MAGEVKSTIVERALLCRRRADEYTKMAALEDVKCNDLVGRMNSAQLREYLERSRKKEDGPAFPDAPAVEKEGPARRG